MYHVAKVLNVISGGKNIISSNNDTQAMLDMWDENLVTVLVADSLADKLKEDDVVLVDYRPKDNSSAPNMVVCKILRGKEGEEIWEHYRRHFGNIKEKKGGAPQPYIR